MTKHIYEVSLYGIGLGMCGSFNLLLIKNEWEQQQQQQQKAWTTTTNNKP